MNTKQRLMKNLKLIFFTVLWLFIGTTFVHSQKLSKMMHWNGKTLELIYIDIDKNNGQLKALYHQAHVHASKVKLKIKKKIGQDRWAVLNPQTKQSLTVLTGGMGVSLTYSNVVDKEFMYAMEYIKGKEKIMMGSLPMLGKIIYQKGDNAPELWLDQADLKCKAGERKGNRSFLCNFTNSKGQQLQLMIDQSDNLITLWRNGVMMNFRSPK